MSTIDDATPPDRSAVDTVAGLMAVGSIVLSLLGMGAGLLLQLDAKPARMIPVAVVLALVAARLSDRERPLALKAALFASFAWVVGMTIAVVTDGPLL